MSELLASIIINNYNYGRFLPEAIDSALAQDYSHTEIIVVDDGSTDESRDVIAGYGRRIVPVIKPNGGQGSAYNAGFAISRGDVVHFLDADDSLDTTAISCVMGTIQQRGVVKAQWPLIPVDAAGKHLGRLSTVRPAPEGDLLQRVSEEGPIYDWYHTTGNAYVRWFLEEILPMPEADYRNGGDVYVLVLAAAYGRIVTIPRALGVYRLHNTNNCYGRQPTGDWLRECIRRFDALSSALQQHLTKRGVPAHPERWRQRNFNYLWPTRLLAAKRDLDALIPCGARYILVDEGEWGNVEPLEGRTAIPFREKQGVFWGPPADDGEAVDELERLRGEGAQFIVFWWTLFSWFEYYPKFAEYLRVRFEQVMATDRLVVFDLESSRPATRI